MGCFTTPSCMHIRPKKDGSKMHLMGLATRNPSLSPLLVISLNKGDRNMDTKIV